MLTWDPEAVAAILGTRPVFKTIPAIDSRSKPADKWQFCLYFRIAVTSNSQSENVNGLG